MHLFSQNAVIAYVFRFSFFISSIFIYIKRYLNTQNEI